MKTAELLETLRTRQPLSWRQVRDRLSLSLPRQSRLDLASDDRYPQESDYGGGSAIVDFLDMKDGWAGPGTFAPSRMIIRNARAFLSRVSAVSRIVPCVSPSPRGTINITYYLDEDRDISVEVGDDELASSTNLDRDDLFLGLSGSCGRCGAITSGRSDQASHRTYPIAGRYVTTQNLPGFLPAIQIR